MHNGGKEVQYDANCGKWIHAFADAGDGNLYWQENTSLDTNSWSARQQIDTSTLTGMTGRFPGRVMQYPGLWFGSVSGQPAKMYIFVPVAAWHRRSSMAMPSRPRRLYASNNRAFRVNGAATGFEPATKSLIWRRFPPAPDGALEC
jgi:hypothetical protein